MASEGMPTLFCAQASLDAGSEAVFRWFRGIAKAHFSEGVGACWDTSRQPLGFDYAGTEQAAIVRDGRNLRCRSGVSPLAAHSQ